MGVYIYKCIDKIQSENNQSLDVSHEANLEYNEHIQKFLERTVWVSGCRSWYKRGTVDGPVSLPWAPILWTKHGLILVRLLPYMEVHRSIMLKHLKTPDGRTIRSHFFQEKLRTVLPILEMASHIESQKVGRFRIYKHLISRSTGICLFFLSCMIRTSLGCAGQYKSYFLLQLW